VDGCSARDLRASTGPAGSTRISPAFRTRPQP